MTGSKRSARTRSPRTVGFGRRRFSMIPITASSSPATYTANFSIAPTAGAIWLNAGRAVRQRIGECGLTVCRLYGIWLSGNALAAAPDMTERASVVANFSGGWAEAISSPTTLGTEAGARRERAVAPLHQAGKFCREHNPGRLRLELQSISKSISACYPSSSNALRSMK
jgi:hypothetical protein